MPVKRTLLPANYFQYVVLVGVILYFGKALFIPLSFGLLISFILYPFCKWMESNRIPRMAAIIIGVSLATILLVGIIVLLFQQVMNFTDVWVPLKLKLTRSINSVSQYFSDTFHWTKAKQTEWVETTLKNSSIGLISFIRTTLYASGISFVMLFIIPIYATLILYYRKTLAEVLFSLFPEEKRKTVNEILQATVHQYFNFIKGMLIVYIIVGTLNSIGLLILGIPHAILFGFIASILTFIPYVGIMAASLLPITVSWLTYDSLWYPVGVIIVFAIVQYLEANVIYPIAVGNRLHVNALVILVVIITGGILWGASGMILFVPFVAILKLIADRTEGWDSLATLLDDEKK